MSKKNARSKQSPKAKKEEKKSKVNPMLLGFVFLVTFVIVYVILNDRKQEAGEQLLKVPAPAVLSVEKAMENLGTVLYIGEASRTPEVAGSKMVLPSAYTAMEKVLDDSDVFAFERLLDKHGISHVVVDPSLARRNPIPKNSVKNRLALAEAAHRLNATYLSKSYFLYALQQQVPALTKQDKRNLLDIVKYSAGVDGVQEPEQLSEALQRAGDNNMILVVRRVGDRHVSFHSVYADTLEDAAMQLGAKYVQYYDRPRFVSEFGGAVEALETKELSLELEVVYDKGVYVGERDELFLWRVFQPGIYGIEINVNGRLHQLPPWYSVTNNYRTLESMMEKLVVENAHQPAGYWLRDDVPLWRFRSVHWRDDYQKNDIVSLYRGMPEPPAPSDISEAALKKSLKAFGDWFVNNTVHYKDNRMIYRYFPTRDAENDEYNQVRHALGAYSMALVNEMVPDERYYRVADKCLKWMEARVRWGGAPRRKDGSLFTDSKTWMGKPLPGAEVAILEADENMYDDAFSSAWSNKMGQVAVAILGYTQFEKAGWELSEERQRILKGLGEFVLYMQRDDGAFNHYYVAPQHHYYSVRNSIYPGEIMYALARLYGTTGDQRFKDAFDRSMKTNLDWFVTEMNQREADGTYAEQRRKDLVQFQPWIAMAMEEMYRYEKDSKYLEASNLVSIWVMDSYQYDDSNAMYPDYVGGYLKVLDELPAMHTFVYTEGTAASYVLAREAGADSATVNRLRKGALLAARFILQQQIYPGVNDYFYPNPERAYGGVRYCMNHNKQRIDYTYHALSSVYRILHAATPDDYTQIQKIELPPAY